MKKIIAVIGSAFGDEGKGRVTSDIAYVSPGAIVVRYNGGAQAGHTVNTCFHRHVFSHFGSGTLYNRPTLLSKYFVCHPPLFIKELQEIQYKIPTHPKVFVSPECFVTTPFDMMLNQMAEMSRGNKRHGSCGIGFGETIERNTGAWYHLKVKHLNDNDLEARLRSIANTYFPIRCDELKIRLDDYLIFKDLLTKHLESVINVFIKECFQFLNNVTIEQDSAILDAYDDIIFEGAQGLLLDMNHKFYPHVTRSNTGLKNILRLIGCDCYDMEVLYVTRPYTTRHGRGPLPHEMPRKDVFDIIDNTNVKNDFQEEFRFSFFQYDLIVDAISSDLELIDSNHVDAKIMMTCCDQIKSKPFFYIRNNEVIPIKFDTMCAYLGDVMDHEVIELFSEITGKC